MIEFIAAPLMAAAAWLGYRSGYSRGLKTSQLSTELRVISDTTSVLLQRPQLSPHEATFLKSLIDAGKRHARV